MDRSRQVAAHAQFEDTITALHSQLTAAGAHLEIDARARAMYATQVRGKANPAVSAFMKKASYAGRGLILLSLAIAVYNVSASKNKVREAGRQAALAGVGIAGSVASGALAGLACGPGAPLCVTIGAFIGGSLSAVGMSMVW